MAEGDITFYNGFKEYMVTGGGFVFSLNTIRVILVASHTPDFDNDEFYSDVSGDEYGTGDGYTAGGALLTNVVITKDTINDRILVNAADTVWAALDLATTPSHAIMYDDDNSDRLICAIELGVTAPTGGAYTLRWSNSPAAIFAVV